MSTSDGEPACHVQDPGGPQRTGAPDLLDSGTEDQRDYDAGGFFADLGRLLDRARPHELALSEQDEERLCRSCFVLGLYEQLQRSPWAGSGSPLIDLGTSGGLDDLLGLCPTAAAQDLACMARAFMATQGRLLSGPAVLNPVFGGSRLVGGADGDLVVDGCYIDIKAAADPEKLAPSQWPWEIRQVMLVTWSLDEYMSFLAGDEDRPSLAQARAQFQEMLAAGTRPGSVAGPCSIGA